MRTHLPFASDPYPSVSGSFASVRFGEVFENELEEGRGGGEGKEEKEKGLPPSSLSPSRLLLSAFSPSFFLIFSCISLATSC